MLIPLRYGCGCGHSQVMSTQETRLLSIKPDGSLGSAFILVDHHAYKMEAISPDTRVPLAYAVAQQQSGTKDWQVVDALDLRSWVWADNKDDAIRKLQRVAGRHRRS